MSTITPISTATTFDIRKSQPVANMPISKDIDRSGMSGQIAPMAIPDIATFDKFSEGYLTTLSTKMDGIFRVDGVIVAATFGDMVVSSHDVGLKFDSASERNFSSVKEKLEAKYGDKLETLSFDSNEKYTFRDFQKGDFFTDADLEKGWSKNQILTDKEFKEAWSKISEFKNSNIDNSLNFKAKA